MVEQSVLFPSQPPVSLVEILIVLTIACLAYFVVFNNFEKHLPIKRRVIKLLVVVGILAIIGTIFSR